MRRDERQVHSKHAAFADHAAHAHVAAEQPSELTSDTGSEAGATAFPRDPLVDLPERVEDALEMLHRDTRPGVGDLELDAIAAHLRRETDVAGRGELHGVREKVDDDLSHLLRVAAHHGARAVPREAELDALLLGPRPNDDRRLLEPRGEPEVLDPNLLASGLDAGEAQNVLDQHEQVLAAGAHARQVIALRLVDR